MLSRTLGTWGCVVISRVTTRVVARVTDLGFTVRVVPVFLTSREIMGQTNIVLSRQMDLFCMVVWKHEETVTHRALPDSSFLTV